MNSVLFIFGEYSLFVWPAFMFTFILCFTLYFLSKKELKKLEKLYEKNIKQEQPKTIESPKEKKVTAKALSGSLIY